MHYYVDGYNLLFRLLRSGESLQASREIIVASLKKKIQLLNLDVILIFDAPFKYGGGTSTRLNHLEIVFTNEGETADEYIINAIKSVVKPREVTVVTSDKRLAWHVRRKAVHTQSVEEFVSMLNSRYKNRLKQMSFQSKKVLPQNDIGRRVEPAANPSPPPTPSKNADTSSKECYEYYFHSFLKEYADLSAELEMRRSEKKGNQKKPSKKLKKKKSPPEESFLSDTERWQHIFEKKLNGADEEL